MINGHRLQDVITVAFSIDIESDGNPSFFQAAFFASVVKNFNGSMSYVIGIAFDFKSVNQIVLHNSNLNFAENAPM